MNVGDRVFLYPSCMEAIVSVVLDDERLIVTTAKMVEIDGRPTNQFIVSPATNVVVVDREL